MASLESATTTTKLSTFESSDLTPKLTHKKFYLFGKKKKTKKKPVCTCHLFAADDQLSSASGHHSRHYQYLLPQSSSSIGDDQYYPYADEKRDPQSTISYSYCNDSSNLDQLSTAYQQSPLYQSHSQQQQQYQAYSPIPVNRSSAQPVDTAQPMIDEQTSDLMLQSFANISINANATDKRYWSSKNVSNIYFDSTTSTNTTGTTSAAPISDANSPAKPAARQYSKMLSLECANASSSRQDKREFPFAENYAKITSDTWHDFNQPQSQSQQQQQQLLAQQSPQQPNLPYIRDRRWSDDARSPYDNRSCYACYACNRQANQNEPSMSARPRVSFGPSSKFMYSSSQDRASKHSAPYVTDQSGLYDPRPHQSELNPGAPPPPPPWSKLTTELLPLDAQIPLQMMSDSALICNII